MPSGDSGNICAQAGSMVSSFVVSIRYRHTLRIFCCVSVRLIVELDGSQHREEIDTARTRYLGSQGWRILRFWNNDALLQTEAVLDAIWNAINDRTLSPTPLPSGEGLKST
jgi:very-short-patch-repair endonuclease